MVDGESREKGKRHRRCGLTVAIWCIEEIRVFKLRA